MSPQILSETNKTLFSPIIAIMDYTNLGGAELSFLKNLKELKLWGTLFIE